MICMINNKCWLSLTLCLALWGLMVGCIAPPPAAEQLAAPALKTVRVTAFPYLSFAPLYIADAEGFFAKEGIAVEFVRFQRNSESLPAFLQGQVDVDSIFTVGLLNAITSGANVRVVANKGLLQPDACPADGFLARSALVDQLATMTPAALQALTFGVDPTWLDSYFLHHWLAERGLDLSQIQTEYLPDPATRAEALRQGAIDIAFFSEPWITRAQESGAGQLWLPAAQIVPDYSLGILSFGPTLLDRTDDLGERFIRAYLQGIAQYNQGKTPRNIEILSQVTQLEADLLQRICWPSFAADGQVDAEAISHYAAWANGRGLADKPLTPAEFWEPRFVDAAK